MNNQKAIRVLQIAAVVMIAGLSFVIADGMREPNVNPGDRAPDFRVVTDSGRTMTRSNFGGKVLVLNFWATWCPPCIEEIPSLDALQKEYGNRGVVVLAVSVDKNENTYRDFLKNARVTFETARDPKADVSASYGTYKYPETYIINRDGTVIAKHISSQNWLDQRILRDILAQL